MVNMELRDYQVRIANEASEILQRKKIVYLACEVLFIEK